MAIEINQRWGEPLINGLKAACFAVVALRFDESMDLSNRLWPLTYALPVIFSVIICRQLRRQWAAVSFTALIHWSALFGWLSIPLSPELSESGTGIAFSALLLLTFVFTLERKRDKLLRADPWHGEPFADKGNRANPVVRQEGK